MISLNISLPQLQMFFLIFLRTGAIVMTMPIFESRSIPPLFKVGLIFAASMILFPILKLKAMPVVTQILPFSIDVIGEILIGVIIGLSVQLIFAGIQLAGQLAGYQMGLAIANVMDPTTSEQVPILSQYTYLMALLIFLTTNAHHWFLRALVESFRLVPPCGFRYSNSIMEQLVSLGGNIFVIAIQVGAPVIAALLLTSVAFGLIARTVPQMNVFIVAMPLKIAVGLLFLGFSLPYLSGFLKLVFNGLGKDIVFILNAMS
jgi:flagellar biosynthetic protein FliR